MSRLEQGAASAGTPVSWCHLSEGSPWMKYSNDVQLHQRSSLLILPPAWGCSCLLFNWGKLVLPRCWLCWRVCVCICRQTGWHVWWDPFYLYTANVIKSWALMPRQLSVFKSTINLFLSELSVIENYLELVAKLVRYKTIINVSETPGKVYYWQGENESPDTNIPLR